MTKSPLANFQQLRLTMLSVLGLALLSIGCVPDRVGGDGASSPDDIILRLRTENDELKKQLDEALAARTAELKKRQKLESTLTQEQRINWHGSLKPTLSSIALEKFSGLVDLDRDGKYDHLRLYLLTQDEQERFLLTLGIVHVIVSHGDERTTQKEWLRHRIEDKELNEMYRTGLMGARFRLMIPLGENWPQAKREVTDETPGSEFGASMKIIFEEVNSQLKLSLNSTVLQYPSK